MISCYGCKEPVDVESCTSFMDSGEPVCEACDTQCIKECGTRVNGSLP